MPHNSYEVISLYFDDSDLSMFYDHAHGVQQRYKYRLRAYRDSQGNLQEKMFFEKKIKNDQRGSKERIAIEDHFGKNSLRQHGDLNVLLGVGVRLHEMSNLSMFDLRKVIPRAFVSYHRKRYASANAAAEINIDTRLTATGVSKLNSALRTVRANFLVMEEKWHDPPTTDRRLIKGLNSKGYPSAFSKYMWAMQSTQPKTII